MSIDRQALMRAVECVTAFFLIGFLGYWLAKRKWFTPDSSAMLSRLVTFVIIPVNLFYTINTATTKEYFLPLIGYMLIPAGGIIATMILSAVAARGFGMTRTRRSVFITAASCSNTINIGLPVNLVLFGTEALPAILVYYMGNTIIFWTVGHYLLASGTEEEGGPKVPIASWATVKRVFSPPMLAFLAGLALLISNVKIPSILALAGSQLAGMTTPLSILCIGIAIFQAGLANIRLNRDVALIALGRFVVSPLIVFILMRIFPVPELMAKVFIIQASLPPMTNIALLAIQYKCDASFASIAISLCTLCALVTVPIFMVLINMG